MTVRIAALAVCVLLLNAVAAHAEIFVTGSGFSSLDNGVTQSPWVFTEDVASDGSRVIAGSGFSSVGPGGPGLSLLQAGGAAAAFAGQGRLGASINTAADFLNVTPGTTFVPRVDASVSARFTDIFEVKSPGLAFGTPVTILYTVGISGDTNNPGLSPGFLGQPLGTVSVSVSGEGFFLAPLRWPAPFAPQSGVPAHIDINLPFNVPTTVGAFLSIDVSLALGAVNRAGLGYGVTEQTIMDFTHTVQFFADPTTADFFLTSASGHDYSTAAAAAPVPLPSNLLSASLIGLTALVCGRLRRR